MLSKNIAEVTDREMAAPNPGSTEECATGRYRQNTSVDGNQEIRNESDKFLEPYNLPRLNHENTENLNGPKSPNKEKSRTRQLHG